MLSQLDTIDLNGFVGLSHFHRSTRNDIFLKHLVEFLFGSLSLGHQLGNLLQAGRVQVKVMEPSLAVLGVQVSRH